ncbi:hypothetical protein LW858_33330 (plasmid) [Bacillus cereus]|uniref:hypothetical protein n=1 Tax=Bacillus cereus TaxID=1396 RepID=UPI001F17FB45|nr:hypothetical protein [Bacillus cereus]UIJ70182.1 hypothetical protein LW858_33330 [Bacillus cereus]
MEEKRDVVGEVHLKTIDVSHITNLAESTIRKYSLELEKQGYRFNKDGDTRLYHTDDVTVFNTLKEIREKTKVSLSHAVAVLITQQPKPLQSVAAKEVAVSMVEGREEQHALQIVSLEIQKHFESMKAEFISFREELETERHKNQELENKLDLIMDELKKLNSKTNTINQEPKRKKLFGLF